MNKQANLTIIEIAVLISTITMALACLIGWVTNIWVAILHIDEPLTAHEIARMVGIPFAPLGVILGWASLLGH